MAWTEAGHQLDQIDSDREYIRTCDPFYRPTFYLQVLLESKERSRHVAFKPKKSPTIRFQNHVCLSADNVGDRQLSDLDSLHQVVPQVKNPS